MTLFMIPTYLHYYYVLQSKGLCDFKVKHPKNNLFFLNLTTISKVAGYEVSVASYFCVIESLFLVLFQDYCKFIDFEYQHFGLVVRTRKGG